MIIWLASYPKSGNTWLRAFLGSYIYMKHDENTFNFDILNKIEQFPQLKHFQNIGKIPKNFDEVTKLWIPMQNKINLNNNIKFLKTHNAYGSLNNHHFTDKNNTLGAIYIVRDPRDVLVSYSKHMSNNIQETLKYILEDNHMGLLDGINNVFSELRGSWGQNYNSWKHFNISTKILIKYEDLIDKPFDTFLKIIKYINHLTKIEVNEDKIQKCIKICEFKNLQNLEKKIGFAEKPKENELFFNKGESKQWINKIDEKILYQIEKKFKKEMKELNYI